MGELAVAVVAVVIGGLSLAAYLAYGMWTLRQHSRDYFTKVSQAAFAAGVEEGLRQSRALDPEVAEVVADTIKEWEKR